MYQYKTVQWLPIPVSEAWTFFSSPMNLSKITPPELALNIRTPMAHDIYNGMYIDYTVKPIWGIPMKWKTEINQVSVGACFMDRQIKGPYKKWEHTHLFEEKEGGVYMTDIVNYELPFGLWGRFMHKIWIRSKIVSIFEYRRVQLLKIFSS